MKISLIVERAQLVEPGALMLQVARLLNGWGASVKVIIPETCSFNLTHIQPTADLYLLASDTPLALSLAGVLHALGAALVNPYPAMNALHNRLIGLRILQAHGVPIPETYVTADVAQIQALLATGPLLLKSLDTTPSGTEVYSQRVVYTARELPTTLSWRNPMIAQRYFESFERQRAIHCIGGQLLGIDHAQPMHRGIRTTFALLTATEKRDKIFPATYRDVVSADSESLTVTELAELALRCGRALGIDLFSIKVVEHHGDLYVVDMTGFPDFSEELEAAPRLAEYLYAKAEFVMEKKRGTTARPLFKGYLPRSANLPSRVSHPLYQ